MRRILLGVSLTLFLALTAFLAWFGYVYASVDKMLWFHAAAVPEAAREAVGPIYFALMKLIGTASLGLAALGAFTALGPVRRGGRGAMAMLAAAYAIPLLGADWVAEHLAAETGAPTSWRIMGVLLATDLAALLCGLAAGGRTGAARMTDGAPGAM